eukprot:3674856-Rhodomonas_salina.1
MARAQDERLPMIAIVEAHNLVATPPLSYRTWQSTPKTPRSVVVDFAERRRGFREEARDLLDPSSSGSGSGVISRTEGMSCEEAT